MRRREFIVAFGGAAVWPLAARAQQTMPVIGFMHSGTPAAVNDAQLTAFGEGLKEGGGYILGQNAAVEFRWANGQIDRLPELAADLVRRKVNVIAATGGPPSNLAAKNATTTIPVVFVSGADPVKVGLVTNVRRPGGNVTGITFFAEELGAKSLSLLRELVRARTVGLLVNPLNSETARRMADTTAAAQKLGLRMEVLHASTASDLDRAFAALTGRGIEALLIGAEATYGGHMQQLISLAARHKMPTMYWRREFPEAGGLASYGTSVTDAYRQAGLYVARVLKGEKAGELPVIQTTKFEFVLNLKTARALGIDVSMAFSAAADEIIE